MSQREKQENDKVYLSIVQGTLRESVPEGTPGSVPRHWEAGGKKGIKHEIIDRAIKGTIVDVSFYEGEHDGKKFQTLNLVLDKDPESGKHPVITTGLDTRYAQDILKKLPNVNFEEEVRIRPFSFIPDGEDKPVTGVEITQQDGTGQFNKKIGSYFHKRENERNIAINGFPVPEGEVSEYDSDDWKAFFIRVKKFLVTYTKENICARFSARSVPADDLDRAVDDAFAPDPEKVGAGII